MCDGGCFVDIVVDVHSLTSCVSFSPANLYTKDGSGSVVINLQIYNFSGFFIFFIFLGISLTFPGM